jgi:hypothetical protein
MTGSSRPWFVSIFFPTVLSDMPFGLSPWPIHVQMLYFINNKNACWDFKKKLVPEDIKCFYRRYCQSHCLRKWYLWRRKIYYYLAKNNSGISSAKISSSPVKTYDHSCRLVFFIAPFAYAEKKAEILFRLIFL